MTMYVAVQFRSSRTSVPGNLVFLPGVSLEISHDTVKLGCLYGCSYRVGMLFDRVGTQPAPLSRVSQSFQTENPCTCEFYQLVLHLLQLILKLDSLYSLSVL